MTAFSAEASDMSGWLLMGLPGVAYLGGMTEAFWTAIGLILGTYLNWLFVAKRLRKFSLHCNDSITIPEYFTNRFKDGSHVLSAVAKLFNSVFNLPYMIALVLGIVVILSYTLLGGYLAVCATDFVQELLMFLALVITAIVKVFSLGGPAQTIETVSKLGEGYLNPFVSANGFGATFGPIILLSLFWRGITRNGALSGLIGGFVTVIIWKLLSGGIFDIYEILPSSIVCLVIAIFVSLLGKSKNNDVATIYDEFITIED